MLCAPNEGWWTKLGPSFEPSDNAWRNPGRLNRSISCKQQIVYVKRCWISSWFFPLEGSKMAGQGNFGGLPKNYSITPLFDGTKKEQSCHSN